MRTRWVTYKNYSGYVVDGGPEVAMPTDGLHIMRAVWLASRLEGSCFGTVQAYDGAGMSGGLLHNIAVSPKDLSQRSFFTLLARVQSAAPAAFAASVGSMLAAEKWHVAPDGTLRDAAGAKVPGAKIRHAFSGPGGKVPRAGSGYQRDWAETFHRLFIDPATHRAQTSYAAEWLAAENSPMEMGVYRGYAPGIDSMIALPSSRLPVAVDLAMCVYHAFSVNAPAIARSCLASDPMIETPADAAEWAKSLIRKLGKRKFGNWTDEPGEGGNRYDKTRKVVWCCGLWDRKLARDLMPLDL